MEPAKFSEVIGACACRPRPQQDAARKFGARPLPLRWSLFGIGAVLSGPSLRRHRASPELDWPTGRRGSGRDIGQEGQVASLIAPVDDDRSLCLDEGKAGEIEGVAQTIQG